MQYYFAPLEGVTNALYRTAHRLFFPPMDKYFAPFVMPTAAQGLSARDCRELQPECNEGIFLVPQLLTNRSEDFLAAAALLHRMGYQEVNLNLGCPSSTVVSKSRGAGLLAKPEALHIFLDEVFTHIDLDLSIKTRIGVEQPEEFAPLLDLFNTYPIKELTIHPRLRTDYYRNHPNLSIYTDALEKSHNPVCYSGDLFSAAKTRVFEAAYPKTQAVMLGRGMVANPGLGEELQSGVLLDKSLLLEFHRYLYSRYQEVLSGPAPVLHKMKELWQYMLCLFPESEKLAKRLRKAQSLSDYETAVSALFRNAPFVPQRGFQPAGN